MSYVKTEYRIMPTEAYRIVRNCPGCGGREIFASTGKFRVNANKSCLDVWLIYRCEKCGHTYNLGIYERVRPDAIPSDEYRQLLANDGERAFFCGTRREIFSRCRAEIDWASVRYELISVKSGEGALFAEEADAEERDAGKARAAITLHNPLGIPVRKDKIVSDILKISRREAKERLRDGSVILDITF